MEVTHSNLYQEDEKRKKERKSIRIYINYICALTSGCKPLQCLHQPQRQHVFLTTEAYNEMPTLRIEGHLNANASHV